MFIIYLANAPWHRAAPPLTPTYDAQWRSVPESDVIQMDETPIRSGRRPGNPGRMKKGFLWPMLGNRGEMAIFFLPSRARECSRPPQ